MALRKYDKDWLQELCKNSYSYAEVLEKAGRKQGGGAQATLKKKIEEFNIDTSPFYRTALARKSKSTKKSQIKRKISN